MAEINTIDVVSNMLVCPFRTEVMIGQRLNDEGVPEQYQLTRFPECQYKLCPFFNPDGKNNNERCFKSV